MWLICWGQFFYIIDSSVDWFVSYSYGVFFFQEGSGSEGESPDVSETPKKEKKRKRAKPQLSGSREEVDRDHPVASSTDGCLKFLKQARANGKVPTLY